MAASTPKEDVVLAMSESFSLVVVLGMRHSGYSSSNRWIIRSRVESKNFSRPGLGQCIGSLMIWSTYCSSFHRHS